MFALTVFAILCGLLIASPASAQHWETGDDVVIEEDDDAGDEISAEQPAPQPDEDEEEARREAAEREAAEREAAEREAAEREAAAREEQARRIQAEQAARAEEARQEQEQAQPDSSPPPAQSERPRPRPRDQTRSAPPETRDEIIAHERAIQGRQEIRDATRRQLQTASDSIHIYQLAEEMIDEVIADISELSHRPLTPVAVRQMGLTSNLNEQFGQFVESTLVTALVTHTNIQVKRCVACSAMSSRVEGDDWVVTRGLVHHEDLRNEAYRLGAEAFLDARFSYFPDANIVAMQIEIFRADDGGILWSETYRSDATTAAILRTGDRVESREERVSELERKLDARPYYGYQMHFGVGHLPYDHPELGYGGIMLGLRLYEQFGTNRQYLYGIGADSFANFSDEGILGSFVYGLLQREILEPNLNRPVVRTGPAVGGFFAGSEGNSFVLEWTLDAIFQFRLGAGASVFYFRPTDFANRDLGGLGAKGRVSFTW